LADPSKADSVEMPLKRHLFVGGDGLVNPSVNPITYQVKPKRHVLVEAAVAAVNWERKRRPDA
jgi:hypothetical protein